MNTLSPLTELKGIGEKTEKLFAKVGVTNVGERFPIIRERMKRTGKYRSRMP